MIIRADILPFYFKCPFYALEYMVGKTNTKVSSITAMVETYIENYSGKKIDKETRMELFSKNKSGEEYKTALSIHRFFERRRITDGNTVDMMMDTDLGGRRKFISVAQPVIINVSDNLKVHVQITLAEKRYIYSKRQTYLDMYLFNDVVMTDMHIMNYWPAVMLAYDALRGKYSDAIRIYSYNYKTGVSIQMMDSASERNKDKYYRRIKSKINSLEERINRLRLYKEKDFTGCFDCEYINECWRDIQ